MTRRLRVLAAALAVYGILLVRACPALAADRPDPDLGPLLVEIRTLVETCYPKASVRLSSQSIHFELNVRTFMVHHLTRVGDQWQDAFEEPGPQPGGIYGTLDLVPGPYTAAALLPQQFDQLYFTVYLAAPFSKRLDRHLYVRLKYPKDTPVKFLEDVRRLTDAFETHVR